MNYPWLDAYLRAKTGVEKDYKAEWEANRYLIRGKMFAMQGQDNDKRDIFTFKIDPAYGELLRGQYPHEIFPGYYMNKQHWISLLLTASVPEDIVRDIAENSYHVLLKSLPKKVQQELLGEEPV